MRLNKIILLSACLSGFIEASADTKFPVPQIEGTVRAKYEYEPQINKGRFEVRNARLGVSGKIIPAISYKAEIDLSDEGKIKMLDAYVRFKPGWWSLTLGQMRVPFSIDAHRSPHMQYFANRSFIAKQVGNVRDVGLAASFTPVKKLPWTIEGGIFNGSGLTGQKDFWTNNYNFSLKTQATFANHYTVELSCQKTCPGDVGIMMWDAGAYFQNERLHVEAEYLRKNYSHDAFKSVNAVDAFAAYRFPLKKMLSGISLLGRYDYMSDHSSGIKDDSGKLVADDRQRQRITGGVTLHFGKARLFADLRLNYEKYFYRAGVDPGISNHDKIVVELMCRF